MNGVDKNEVEERLTTGILGQWYVVAKSVQVKRGKPHGVKALGRISCLWRDTQGKLNCLEDYCPHRGARLSRGEVNADNISCRYHGVTLDGSGTIVQVPAMPGCALEGRKAVDSYAVIEANDGIFVYFPSKESPSRRTLELPAEFSDPTWSSILCMGRWDCSYRYVHDNFADPMHACYLHADSFTLAFGAKQDVMQVEQRDDGFYIARVEQKDVNLDWTHVVHRRRPGLLPAGHSLSGRRRSRAGRSASSATPRRSMSSSCMVFFWRFRQVSGIAREVLAVPLSGDAGAAPLARARAGPRDAHQHSRRRP